MLARGGPDSSSREADIHGIESLFRNESLRSSLGSLALRNFLSFSLCGVSLSFKVSPCLCEHHSSGWF